VSNKMTQFRVKRGDIFPANNAMLMWL